LVRAPACHAGGCGFKPRRSRQNEKGLAGYANPFFVNNFVVRTPLPPSVHMVILPRGVDLAWEII
jgi:hypothetical protein